MANVYYNAKDLYFEYGDFTPATEETCGVYFLSSNTRMLALALIQHYGKWRNRYTTNLSLETKPKLTEEQYDEIFTIVDLAIKELMADCNLDRMSHSLTEIEFTLKHLLTKLTDETQIKFFIDKPAEPPLLNDGTWDLSVNNAITSPGMSVFTVGSLLENNSITDVLKIATLDDGTIQFPDINPFNLESKFDTLNETAIQAKDIHEWFGSAFWSGRFSDLNPFSFETFFQRFSATFNIHYPLTQIISESFYGLHKKLNDNVVTSFNETNTDGVASNSYFRYLHTWLNSDWKLFHDLMETMRDCICEAKEAAQIANTHLQNMISAIVGNTSAINGVEVAINNLDLSPTVNNYNEIIVDGDSITNNSTTNNTTTTTTTTTITNPDGSTTTINNTSTEINYPPINPTDPQSPTSQPYATKYVTPSSNHDEVCGFIWYTMSALADWVEWLISWLNPLTPIMQAMGINAFATWVLSQLDGYGQFYIAKLGQTVLRSIASKWLGLAGLAIDVLPDYIREVRNDMACPNGNIQGNWTVSELKQEMINGLQALTGQNLILDFASYCIHVFYDSGLYDPALEIANINMADYAQYCPCPVSGNFSGHWWNGITGTNEKHWYITDDTIYVQGTHTSKNVFGTVYTSEIQNGVIDPQNPLSASGVLHVISHSGFGDTAFTISINAQFTQLYYNGQTYTKQ